MGEERGPESSALKGRLADVFVATLVEGSLDQLSRRLGSRATIDDPLFGRASTLASIDPLLAKLSAYFREHGVTYRHVASANGVDRDLSEGILTLQRGATTAELPIAVVAERRRLREIELRLYYATGEAQRKSRSPFVNSAAEVIIPQLVGHVLEALRKGAVERVLSAFEEGSRWIDPLGKAYGKRDGSLADYISGLGGRLELDPYGAADDGRTCCIEANLTRQRPLQDPEPAALSFERGESGLLRELRLYYEP